MREPMSGRLRDLCVAATLLVAGSAFFPLPIALAHEEHATGDWGGVRTRLAEAGVEIQIDYIAESYVLDGDENISYLGNLDVAVALDTEKLGAWPGGTIFVYGEDNHSRNISESLDLLMQVSNLDSEEFTQLSEFWLEQKLGDHIAVRLGKQDGNRDFANARFAGNFVNSSFGVLPGSPLPSFPAPALGATVLTDWTRWFGVRAAIYEGNPQIESFAGHAFEDHAGVMAIGSLNLRHDVMGQQAAELAFGGWTHSGQDRSGMWGVYDVLLYVHPGDRDDVRSVQAFVRGNWSPKEAKEEGEINSYAGGGLTAHAFLGSRNTIGIGAGHARTDTSNETFVELFFKWRLRPWFTIEPDLQVYDAAGGRNPVFAGVRIKLKL